MKKLILSNEHEELGAKMIDFAGYYMPIQYEGVKAEHYTVRNKVGIFDVSHMGEVFISGDKSEEFLQYITSNDVSKLSPGKVQYTYLPNTDGGIVDDLLLYMISKDNYLLVLNASNIEKDLEWIKKNNNFDCQIDDKSAEYSLLAIQGPQSIQLLREITDLALNDIKYYNFKIGNIAGINNVIISRTGYTGELGFELYVNNNDVKDLWNILFNTSIELKPIGLAARDTLRLEKGFCLYGNDIDESTSPIEAGLGWVTKFTKDFINSDFLKSQQINGVKRKLVGLELLDRGIARKDYYILNKGEEKIGVITSGTMSPTLGKSIALGYINSEYIEENKELFILIRNKKIKAKITTLPFVKNNE